MPETSAQSAQSHHMKEIEFALEKLLMDRIILKYRIFSENEYDSILSDYIPVKKIFKQKSVVVFCRISENQSPNTFKPVLPFTKTNLFSKKKFLISPYRVQSYTMNGVAIFLIFSNQKIREFFKNKGNITYNHDQILPVLGV